MYINRDRKEQENRKVQKNPYINLPWDDSISDKWQQKRKQRLNRICDILRSLRKVPYQKFVAQLAITTGIRSHIIRSYLDEIKNAGLITIKNNTIIWNHQNTILESRV